MADHVLIDQYLGELRCAMGRLAHAEEIIEEVADHLLEALSVAVRAGVDRSEAQRRVLAEFGDPKLVGRAFASTTTGGIAVPTDFTRRSGVFLIVSSALWLAAFVFMYASSVADRTQPWEGTPQTLFTVFQSVLVLAAVTALVGIVGLVRRHGGSMGIHGRIATWLGVLGVLAALPAWAVVVWSTVLAVAAIALALGMSKVRIAPWLPTRLMALGAIAISALFWWYEVRIDLGGDDLVGWIVPALAASFVLFAAGLGAIGLWLRGEKPVDAPPAGVPA